MASPRVQLGVQRVMNNLRLESLVAYIESIQDDLDLVKEEFLKYQPDEQEIRNILDQTEYKGIKMIAKETRIKHAAVLTSLKKILPETESYFTLVREFLDSRARMAIYVEYYLETREIKSEEKFNRSVEKVQERRRKQATRKKAAKKEKKLLDSRLERRTLGQLITSERSTTQESSTTEQKHGSGSARKNVIDLTQPSVPLSNGLSNGLSYGLTLLASCFSSWFVIFSIF